MRTVLLTVAAVLSMAAGSAYAATGAGYTEGYGRAASSAPPSHIVANNERTGSNLPTPRQSAMGDSKPAQGPANSFFQSSGLNGGGG